MHVIASAGSDPSFSKEHLVVIHPMDSTMLPLASMNCCGPDVVQYEYPRDFASSYEMMFSSDPVSAHAKTDTRPPEAFSLMGRPMRVFARFFVSGMAGIGLRVFTLAGPWLKRPESGVWGASLSGVFEEDEDLFKDLCVLAIR